MFESILLLYKFNEFSSIFPPNKKMTSF